MWMIDFHSKHANFLWILFEWKSLKFKSNFKKNPKLFMLFFINFSETFIVRSFMMLNSQWQYSQSQIRIKKTFIIFISFQFATLRNFHLGNIEIPLRNIWKVVHTKLFSFILRLIKDALDRFYELSMSPKNRISSDSTQFCSICNSGSNCATWMCRKSNE